MQTALLDYRIEVNAADDVMIITKTQESAPDNARLLYDGSDHALLYHAQERALILDFIAQEAQPYLASAETVLIAETENLDTAHVVRSYFAPVKKVPTLSSLIDMPSDEALEARLSETLETLKEE